MILTYSNKRFPPLIKAGVKIHTLREDKGNRWRKGLFIQHWMGSPRNPSKRPHQVCTEKVYICQRLQKIILTARDHPTDYLHAQIDDRPLSQSDIEALARNDGFSSPRQMAKWFFKKLTPRMEMWKGKIIHWTDFKY